MSDRESKSLRPLPDALAKLTEEVRVGLKHGFFEYSVSSEIIQGGKRSLTLRVGKSYKYVIPAEDVQN